MPDKPLETYGGAKPKKENPVSCLRFNMKTCMLLCVVALIFSAVALAIAHEGRYVLPEVVVELNATSCEDHVPLYTYLCEDGSFVSYGYRKEGNINNHQNCMLLFTTIECFPEPEPGKLDAIIEAVKFIQNRTSQSPP